MSRGTSVRASSSAASTAIAPAGCGTAAQIETALVSSLCEL